MGATLPKPMTVETFLAWEQRQELKWEFDGFGPVAMAGGTVAHARLQINIAVAMSARLRGTRCEAFGSDLKIEVVGRIRYPDGFVVCSPVEAADHVVRDPVVVFEVLSPSTSRTDRVLKTREYGATPSVARYIMLEQDAVAATVFSRERGDWAAQILGPEDVLAMPEIGIEVPVAELYAGLEYPATPGE